METLSSTSGFNSEASLQGSAPQTPPYTPHRGKRPLERNDSPASAKSIHPFETSSPAKKSARRQVNDEVKVEELTEGDAGYITDVDVVYPHELEEVESDSDRRPEEIDDDDDDESGDDILTRLSQLECEDDVEAEFEKKRRAEHLKKRRDSRAFKRSHSQSVKSDTDVTDPDAMADHDVLASARRLRRRVRGPGDADAELNDAPRSSPMPRSVRSSVEIIAPRTADESDDDEKHEDDEAMDVDEPK